MNPVVASVQQKLRDDHGKELDLEHIGNWDEWFLDLTQFGVKGKVLVIQTERSQILIPFERSPHISVITGFMGGKALPTAVLLPRKSVQPHHAEHLDRDGQTAVYCTSEASGWVCKRTKEDIFNKWVEDPTNIIGQEPTLMMCDGHDTNVVNLPLLLAMRAAKVEGVVTPAHHTTVLQAADASRGPIATIKTHALSLIERHFLSGGGVTHISAAQIAWVVQEAVKMTPVEVYSTALKKTGWITKGGSTAVVKYEPLCVISPDMLSPEPIPAAGTTRSGRSVRARRADPVMEAISRQDPAVLQAATTIVQEYRKDPIPKDQHATRQRANKSYNEGGLVVTAASHVNHLLQKEEDAGKAEEARKMKHLQSVAKWLPLVKASEKKLASKGDDLAKLSKNELDAFCYGRLNKHVIGKKNVLLDKAKTIKDQAVVLGNCAMCVSAGVDYKKEPDMGFPLNCGVDIERKQPAANAES